MVHAVIEDGYISPPEEDKQPHITGSVEHTQNQQNAAAQIRKQVRSRRRKANEAETRKKPQQPSVWLTANG